VGTDALARTKHVVVLGAGREALVLEGYCQEIGYEPAVFVEETPPTYDRDLTSYGAPIHTFDEDLTPFRALPAICAVGSPKLRQRLVDRWHQQDYLTLVSRRAWIAPNAIVGPGSNIAPLASVNRNAKIGAHVLVNPGAVLSHDVVVGDFVTIGPACALAGRVSIGSAAFLGIGATVINGIRIGDAAYVAAGAVVVEDVPDGQLVMGVPARVVPRRPGLE